MYMYVYENAYEYEFGQSSSLRYPYFETTLMKTSSSRGCEMDQA
jgi:hypothetical protein